MHHRIIEIANYGVRLAIEHGSLKIESSDRETARFRLEELDCILLSNPAVSLSGGALAGLLEANVAVVVCDRQFRPAGISLPFGCTRLTNLFRCQIGVGVPLQKRLWQHVIQEKIRRQASVLRDTVGNDCGLAAMVSRVRSGDADNIEAVAAIRFWRSFPGLNRRDRNAADLNLPLNYVYMVLWAMMARAICAAGLHPSLGIWHHNQYNEFCLASDLIEPYREIGERAVLAAAGEWEGELTKELKKRLLEDMLNSRFATAGGEKCALTEAMQRTAVSLRESYVSGEMALEFPRRV